MLNAKSGTNELKNGIVRLSKWYLQCVPEGTDLFSGKDTCLNPVMDLVVAFLGKLEVFEFTLLLFERKIYYMFSS